MKRRNFVAGSFVAATGSLLANQAEDKPSSVENKEVKCPEAPVSPPAKGEKPVFNFANVTRIAQQLSSKPYKPETLKLIAPFADLSYDRYRAIRFRRNKDPLRQRAEHSLFGLDLLPPGRFYRERVQIFLVEKEGNPVEIPFSLDRFDFDSKFFVQDSLQLDHEALAGLSY